MSSSSSVILCEQEGCSEPADSYRNIQYSQITYYCRPHIEHIQKTTRGWCSLNNHFRPYTESERDSHIIKCAWLGNECKNPAIDWAYKDYIGWGGRHVQKKCYHCLEHTPVTEEEEDDD